MNNVLIKRLASVFIILLLLSACVDEYDSDWVDFSTLPKGTHLINAINGQQPAGQRLQLEVQEWGYNLGRVNQIKLLCKSSRGCKVKGFETQNGYTQKIEGNYSFILAGNNRVFEGELKFSVIDAYNNGRVTSTAIITPTASAYRVDCRDGGRLDIALNGWASSSTPFSVVVIGKNLAFYGRNDLQIIPESGDLLVDWQRVNSADFSCVSSIADYKLILIH